MLGLECSDLSLPQLSKVRVTQGLLGREPEWKDIRLHMVSYIGADPSDQHSPAPSGEREMVYSLVDFI